VLRKNTVHLVAKRVDARLALSRMEEAVGLTDLRLGNDVLEMFADQTSAPPRLNPGAHEGRVPLGAHLARDDGLLPNGELVQPLSVKARAPCAWSQLG
jgi:hypothetical protein